MDPQDLNELRSVEELLAYQTELKGRAEELHAEFDGVPMPEEQDNEFKGAVRQSEEIDKRVAHIKGREDALERLANEPARQESGAVFREDKPSMKERDIYDLHTVRENPMDPDSIRSEYRDRALRAIELATFPGLDNPKIRGKVTKEDVQTHLERLIEHTQQERPGEVAQHLLRTGSPIYKRAFGKALTGSPLSSEEQRALGLGATVGGQAVPFTLDPTIIPTSNSVVNPARALARIESIVGSNTWNGVSSGAITATRVAEIAPATDNSPTMAAPTATVTKAHAFVPFSVEIEADWASIGNELAKLFQDAKDDDEGTQFVTGVGTTVFPQGFVTGTTATVAAAGGLTITAANVRALEAALGPRFRGNEQFVANRGIYNAVAGIDTAGGAALWIYLAQGLNTQSPTPGNTGAVLLGRGAWEASAMQATIVNATKIMVVGDFSYFLIVDRLGLHIELIPHLFGAAQGNLPVGQRAYYCWWRNTSKVLSAAAFVALTGTT